MALPRMKCLLCQEEKKLVRAHIIPRAFYRLDHTDRRPARLVTNVSGRHTKKVPIGIYDDGIVCEECEHLFSPWDDYAAEIFLHQWGEFRPIRGDGKDIALVRETYSYTKLKMFFISLLWRAGVSSHEMFDGIDLGPHESVLRQSLLAREPGDINYFSVLLQAFSDTTNVGILNPHSTRLEGIRFYRFYVAHVIAHIKVDARPLPDPFDKLAFAEGRNLIVLSKSFHSSQEKTVMRSLVLTDRDRKGGNRIR